MIGEHRYLCSRSVLLKSAQIKNVLFLKKDNSMFIYSRTNTSSIVFWTMLSMYSDKEEAETGLGARGELESVSEGGGVESLSALKSESTSKDSASWVASKAPLELVRCKVTAVVGIALMAPKETRRPLLLFTFRRELLAGFPLPWLDGRGPTGNGGSSVVILGDWLRVISLVLGSFAFNNQKSETTWGSNPVIQN